GAGSGGAAAGLLPPFGPLAARGAPLTQCEPHKRARRDSSGTGREVVLYALRVRIAYLLGGGEPMTPRSPIIQGSDRAPWPGTARAPTRRPLRFQYSSSMIIERSVTSNCPANSPCTLM